MRLQSDLWLHLARTDKIALGKLLLVSGLSREFLSAFDENTIDALLVPTAEEKRFGGEASFSKISCSAAVSDDPLK